MCRRAAALFSGGKDSVLAVYEARRMGYCVEELIMLETTLPIPNPHLENLRVVRRVAGSMGLPVRLVRLRRGREMETLARALREMGVEALVAGDILVEDHVVWLERVASMAGVELVEPLFGRSTRSVFLDMMRLGFVFVVIAVRSGLPGWMLGFEVNDMSGSWFLDVLDGLGVDPVGEYGEYHSIVLRSPLSRMDGLRIVLRGARVVGGIVLGWFSVV